MEYLQKKFKKTCYPEVKTFLYLSNFIKAVSQLTD